VRRDNPFNYRHHALTGAGRGETSAGFAPKLIDHCLTRFGKGLEVVAALQGNHQPPAARFGGNSVDPLSHCRKARFGHPHGGERIAEMTIEASRYKHEIGRESACRWNDQLIESAEILPVAEVRRQRHIERVTRTRARAHLADGAGARIMRILMYRDVHHLRRFVKDLLRAVAVMDIPVDYQDTVEAVIHEPVRADRNIVEQAKAHRVRRTGVMARRTDDRKRIVGLAFQHRLDRTQNSAGAQQSCAKRMGRSARVGIEVVAVEPGGSRHLRDIAAVVAERHFIERRFAWRDQTKSLAPKPFDHVVKRIHPFRPFRMGGAGAMLAVSPV
jgi:hypothetical protein